MERCDRKKNGRFTIKSSLIACCFLSTRDDEHIMFSYTCNSFYQCVLSINMLEINDNNNLYLHAYSACFNGERRGFFSGKEKLILIATENICKGLMELSLIIKVKSA